MREDEAEWVDPNAAFWCTCAHGTLSSLSVKAQSVMGSRGNEGIVMVAVSKHRSSLSALEWTLLNKVAGPGSSLRLVHVRPRLRSIPTPMGGFVPENRVSPEIVATYRSDLLLKVKEDLQAHQSLCSKWKVQAELVIVEGDDVAMSLLDQVSQIGANKFVLGKSRPTLLRRFKGCRIADTILKHASDTCTVYIISNGKLVSSQSAGVSPQLSLTVDALSCAGVTNGLCSDTMSSSNCSSGSFSAPDGCSGKKLSFWKQGEGLDMPTDLQFGDLYQHRNLIFGVDKSKLMQLDQHLQVAR